MDTEDQDFSQSLVAIPMQSDFSRSARENQIVASDSFHKQIQVLKTILELSDADLKKIKIEDMPKLMKKATKQATIGHMKKLLSPKPGFLEKLLFRRRY